MASDNPRNVSIDDTVIDTWFERDRAYVILYLKDADGGFGETIAEWWDGAVGEAIEDGFLNSRDYHTSAFEYAAKHGLLDPANRTKREPVPTGWVIDHDEFGTLLTWRGGEMVWSGAAQDADLERGAVSFESQRAAEEFFDDRDDGFRERLAYHEIALDVAVSGRGLPSRASIKSLEEAGVDLKRQAPTPAA